MIGNSLFIGNQVEWTALDPEKDAGDLSAWTRNLHFSRTLFDKPVRPYAVHEVKKKIKADLKAAEEKLDAYYFAVRKKGEPKMVCLLRFGRLQNTQQVGKLFINFASHEDLKDYGQEVLTMALHFGFMELSLHRLWIEIPGYCVEEINLIESAGFL
jgi:RimJ/RimL family protein N-acetyltransferase